MSGSCPPGAPSLWDWAVKVYDLKGVADTLLRMQDEDGLNVNAILWCIWASSNFDSLTPEQVSHIFAGNRWWQQEVVSPLRVIRRKMKSSRKRNNDYHTLTFRKSVKELELLAEKNELAALCQRTCDVGELSDHPSLNQQEQGLENFQLYYQFGRKVESQDKVLNHVPSEQVRERFLAVQLLILQEAIHADV